MAPRYFFRVQDEDSRARCVHGRGIFAEDRYTGDGFHAPIRKQKRRIKNHLNWSSVIASIHISTYCDKVVAFKEAKRRVKEGKEAVRVYKIDTWGRVKKSGKPVEYRNMRVLAEKLGVYIPERAWNNSKYEYIFLHHIPESAVVRSWKFY
ncbi:hypothetical protein BGZ60DRAFT_398917 [Tricladium varicosporioides]|nr:hypothetical protein BGZ60DRAFT_398917 [Hymenoscyphus varicosporioides]